MKLKLCSQLIVLIILIFNISTLTNNTLQITVIEDKNSTNEIIPELKLNYYIKEIKQANIQENEINKEINFTKIISSPNNIILNSLGDIAENLIKEKSNKKDYQLNIYNSFVITNSTITQLLDDVLTKKKSENLQEKNKIKNLNLKENNKIISVQHKENLQKIRTEYLEKLKLIEISKNIETKNLMNKYSGIINDLQNKNKNNLQSLKEYQERLEKLYKSKDFEKENLQKKYQEKIIELTKLNKISVEELQKKDIELNDLKKENVKENILLKNKEQQIIELKELLIEKNYTIFKKENKKNNSEINKIKDKPILIKKNLNFTIIKSPLEKNIENYLDSDFTTRKMNKKVKKNIEAGEIKNITYIKNLNKTLKKIIPENNDNLLYPRLYCAEKNHIDSTHFLMNIEKCRQLNNIYSNFYYKLHLLENKV